MNNLEILKLIHVLGAIVWVGGAVLMIILGFRVAKADLGRRLGYTEDMNFVGGRVFAPASIVTLSAGIWLVIWHPAYDFNQLWIILALGGIAVSIAIGMGFYPPQGNALIAELKAGNPAAEARSARIARVSMVDTAILLIVVWAMVAKPGL